MTPAAGPPLGLGRKLLATVGFAGYAPVAPGTAGSAVCAVLYYFFCSSLGVAGWVLVLTAVFFVGVWAADGAARAWGKDPSRVVVDEAVGLLFTVAFLPHGFWTAVAGFCLFRVFDIAKPPPIRRLEKLPGGWGIVADDVLAGIYGHLALRAAWQLTGWALPLTD